MTVPMRLGLTGGIGSGKSTVARMLAARGAAVVDTDAIARALTGPGGAAIGAIAAGFGAEVIGPDGALDRAAMRALAFGDGAARARLEAILHPLIGARAAVEAELAEGAGAPLLVFDVPLLAESRHWRARVQRVLVVDCSEATQAQRVAQRPGWTEAMAQRVIAQQASRALRRSMADAVIFNEGIALGQLEAEIDALWGLWAPGRADAPG